MHTVSPLAAPLQDPRGEASSRELIQKGVAVQGVKRKGKSTGVRHHLRFGHYAAGLARAAGADEDAIAVARSDAWAAWRTMSRVDREAHQFRTQCQTDYAVSCINALPSRGIASEFDAAGPPCCFVVVGP
jgi:hypothetical protein